MRWTLGGIGAGFLAVALMVVWPSLPVRAEVTLSTENTEEMSHSKTTDKESGQVTSTDSNRFDQLYHLDIANHLYPNLSFDGGGVFQSNDNKDKSEGSTTSSGQEILHPFFDLNLGNPIYSLGGGVEKTEIRKTGTGQATTVDSQDQMHGRFLWEPADLPRLNLNYNTAHRYDDTNTTDQQQDDLGLGLRYSWRDIFANYSYIQSENDDMISGLKARNNAHDGRISFNHNLTKDLSFSSSYRADYATQQWSGSGQPFLAPLMAGSAKGFYLLTDTTPASWDAATQINDNVTFLSDGVKSGTSAINLGLSGDETKNVGFGIDFGFPTDVSTLRVWVNNPNSAYQDASEVANAFVWTVYTSDDERTWTQQLLTHPVTYTSGLDNYFEITLADTVAAPLTARYIKVVTKPLTNAQDVAGHFRDLYVTELEPFTLQKGNVSRQSFDNSADMSLNWSLNPKTTMGYSGFYRSQRTDEDMLMQRDSALSQTISLNRIINRFITGSLRGSRDERQSPTEQTLDNSYGAALTAGWLDTFRQSLAYSGSNSDSKRPANRPADVDVGAKTEETDELNKNSSVSLRNILQLYRGWSADLDFGYSWNTPWNEGTSYGKTFRLGSSFIPHPKLTLTTAYSYTRTVSDRPPIEDQQLEFSAAFNPTTAISLFSRVTVDDQAGVSKVYQDYSVGWAPFPDGAMQFSLSYNEDLNTEGDHTKAAQAGFNWRINSAAVLQTTFSDVTADSVSEITKSQMINTTLRITL